jgi:hypothetical protein
MRKFRTLEESPNALLSEDNRWLAPLLLIRY